jgi:hypothetical protein
MSCVGLDPAFLPSLIHPFLGKSASRMHVLSVSDLEGREAVQALTRMRRDANKKPASPEEIRSIVDMVGGRLSYLNRVSGSS